MKIRFSILCLFILVTGTIRLFAGEGDLIHITNDLYLEEIADKVWVHVSFTDFPPWGRISANGIAVLTDNQVILIDTPFNNSQTQSLVEWFEKEIKVEVKKVIVSHFHDDNLGGLGWIHESGIDSYSIEKTQDLCRKKDLIIPQNTLQEMSLMEFSKIPIQMFFPGEGHTVDNICVYLPKQKILFGGCSVKALNNKTLGNTADANIVEWPSSLQKMKDEFSDTQIVIPGHGKTGTLELIDYTLTLF